MQTKPSVPEYAPGTPDILWTYYKRIKASGFLDLLPILASAPPPTVEERRQIAQEFSRAKISFLASLTMPEQAHNWLKVVQLLQYYESSDWGYNTIGGVATPVPLLVRRDWKEVRTHVLSAAWSITANKGRIRK